MGWHFLNAHENFARHRDAWDDLNWAHGNHILLDSGFVAPLIRYFAPPNTLLGVANGSVANRGLLLVNKGSHGFWHTFQPSQAPLGLILLKDMVYSPAHIREIIFSLPGYALGLSVLHQDPDCTLFRGLDERGGGETIDYIQTSRLSIRGSFAEYWRGLGKNLTHNLSRQLRRLADRGVGLELVVERDPARMADCVREYGSFEEAGWKGKAGTAVTVENRQGLFYKDVLEDFCSRDEAVVYRLLMDGKAVASDLCLHRNGTMVILKTAYDESLKNVSPGLLLHMEIFKHLFSEGTVQTVEFYGRVRDWHTQWTKEIRTMHHLNFFRYGLLLSMRRAWSALARIKS